MKSRECRVWMTAAILLAACSVAFGDGGNPFPRTAGGIVFKGVEIYNAVELVPTNGLHLFRRVNARAEASMPDRQKDRAVTTTGVELRFRMLSDEVKLVVGTDTGRTQTAHVYQGDVIVDWPNMTKSVSDGETVWTFRKTDLARLRARVGKYGRRYDPEVVRIVLQPGRIGIRDVIGEAEPPPAELLPKKTYLAYGSSITHGSDSLIIPRSFVSLVGDALGADVRNLGLAGSALMQPEMADFLAGESFDYCSLELGVNTLGRMSLEEYERRVRYMVRRVAESHPAARILAIDIFRTECTGERLATVAAYRAILARVVKELNLPNVRYVNGLDVLSDRGTLSSGLLHPSPKGHEEIAAGLSARFRAW